MPSVLTVPNGAVIAPLDVELTVSDSGTVKKEAVVAGTLLVSVGTPVMRVGTVLVGLDALLVRVGTPVMRVGTVVLNVSALPLTVAVS